MSLYCTFDGTTPVASIHEASRLLEVRLKAAIPRLDCVQVRAEPA